MKRIRIFKMLMTLIVFISIFSFVLPVLAQGDVPPAPAPAPVDIWTIAIGAAVSLIVTFSKKLTFVNENPKVIATVLSLIGAVAASLAMSKGGLWVIVQQFVVTLLAAIGTHEVVVKPMLKSGQ
jgi:hypothetical protein